MNYSEETLMAFADGELDAALRAEIEAAIASDLQLALRVAAHKNLRERLQRAYAGELKSEPPQRLLDMLAAPSATAGAPGVQSAPGVPSAPGADSNVIALDSRRSKKAARTGTPRRWAALAASLVIGVTAGYVGFEITARAPIAAKQGVLVADAALGRSLTHSPAGEGSAAGPKIGISYRSKSGDLCRSFTESAFAGIACRDGDDWRIRMLTQRDAADASQYRAAASELPPAIRAAIDADIAGEPLDAAAEREALERGWR